MTGTRTRDDWINSLGVRRRTSAVVRNSSTTESRISIGEPSSESLLLIGGILNTISLVSNNIDGFL